MLDQPVPDFELPATGGGVFRLSESRGRTLVLYFYPKDNTPGCSDEGLQFRDLHTQFANLGARIYGISRDSLKSHEGFKAKMSLSFDLLSDADEKACGLFGVIRQKILYGKPVRGIERSTFVLDGKGVLRREWREVKVPGHAQEVLDYVRTLS